MNARNPVYHTPLPQGTTLLNGTVALDNHNNSATAHQGELLPITGGNLAGQITVPKATDVGQVPRITVRDATVGVLELNGMPIIHTPEQIILSWTNGVQDSANQIGTIDTANFTINGTGTVRIQRIGAMVRLSMPNGTSSGLIKINAGQQYLLTGGATGPTLPAGYNTISQGYVDGYAAFRRMSLYTTASGGRMAFLEDGTTTAGINLNRARWEWFTSDDAPTSIVGIAAPGTGVNI